MSQEISQPNLHEFLRRYLWIRWKKMMERRGMKPFYMPTQKPGTELEFIFYPKRDNPPWKDAPDEEVFWFGRNDISRLELIATRKAYPNVKWIVMDNGAYHHLEESSVF